MSRCNGLQHAKARSLSGISDAKATGIYGQLNPLQLATTHWRRCLAQMMHGRRPGVLAGFRPYRAGTFARHVVGFVLYGALLVAFCAGRSLVLPWVRPL